MDISSAAMAGWIAGVLSVAGYIPYIWSIVTGRTRSAGQLTSWLIWSVEYSVLFAALIAAGDRDALWLPGAELAGTLVTAALVWWRREPGIDWERVGLYVLLCAGALGIWMVAGNPYIGVLIVLAVDGTGIVLTMRGAYFAPGGELPEAWACWAAGGVAGCVAARHGGLLGLAFPVFLAITCAGVLVAIALGEHRHFGRHRLGAVIDTRVGDLVPSGLLDSSPLYRPYAAPMAPERQRRTGRSAVSGLTLAACAVLATLVLSSHVPNIAVPVATGLHPAGPNRPMHPRTRLPVPQAAVVVLEKMQSPIGPVLADGHGRTVYKLLHGTCTGSCLTRWHPEMGHPGAALGAHLTGHFGETPSGQATYRDKPLWTYAGDHQPGDVGGQGLARRWAVMTVSAAGPVVSPVQTDAHP